MHTSNVERVYKNYFKLKLLKKKIFALLHNFSLHFFKFKGKSIVSYSTATLLLFDNLMFRGKSLK